MAIFREKLVTFTVLEDGMYLPSIGVVLPEGEYRGRIVMRGGKVIDVILVLSRSILDQLGLDRNGTGPLSWSIIREYWAGAIREDRLTGLP